MEEGAGAQVKNFQLLLVKITYSEMCACNPLSRRQWQRPNKALEQGRFPGPVFSTIFKMYDFKK